jgi:hypothetical protein
VKGPGNTGPYQPKEKDVKVSNPYGASDNFKVPPETIQAENRQASSKAKARFPHKPLGTGQSNGQAGKAKVHALTPGSSPSGS